MTVRTVTVRYAADMSSLLKGLDEGAKRNAKLADSADKTGKRIDNLAKGGAAVAVGIGYAVAKFAEFDAQMSATAAATGASGRELKSLRDAAVKAGEDTKFSATEAAQGITELAKAGVSTADILRGGLTGALNLAAAGQISVADAAEVASTAMTQFGLSGSQVSHVADLLAAGAGKAQGGVGDLGMALKQAGLVASQTGLTIEETTAGLTAFASAGLLGSDAGTSFKSMLQRLTPQSAEAQAKMDELGISAYDAGGNFIGLAAFAGNLQTALRDLTPEQRNAAMATIFGSDAVRAASILYKEGEAGIREWTEQVNQSGFAAKTAATLNDNLRGDLERLSGQLETTFINTGSGANSSLRTIVQTLEGFVELVGKIPGPVLLGAAALTAFALAGRKIGALATTAFAPVSGAMGRFRQELALQRALAPVTVSNFQRMGGAATALSRSIGGLGGAAKGLTGALGGPWGIALSAAVIGLGAFAEANANAQRAADDLTATLDEQTGAFSDASRETIADALKFDVSGEDLNKLKQYGVDLKGAVDAAIAGGPVMEAYRNKLVEVAVKHGDASNAAYGLASSIENQNEVVQRSKADWEARRALLGEQAEASGEAAAQTEGLTNKVDLSTVSMQEAQGPTAGLGDLLAFLGAKSEEAKTRLDDLKSAVDLLSGGELALRAATRDMAQAIEDAGKAAQEKASKTKSAAQVEREFQASLDRVALSTQEVIKQMMDNGAASTDLQKKYDEGRAAIEKQLKARGLHGAALQAETDKIIGTKGEFAKLLAEYGKTPPKVTTLIVADATGAKRVIDGIQTQLNTLNGRIVTTTVRTNYVTIGNAPMLPGSGTLTYPRFMGGIVRAYAAGGLGDVANAHVAQIARPGSWRVWGEPETQGESYIPHANDWRRPRAKRILEVTAQKLGASVQWNAAGSYYGTAGLGQTRAMAAMSALFAGLDAATLAAAVEAGAARGTEAGMTGRVREERRQIRQRDGVGA